MSAGNEREKLLIAVSVGLLSVSTPGTLPPAYIDPTGGGLLLQIVLGGTAGVLVLGRLAWRNVTSAFRRSRKKTEDDFTSDLPQSK